MVTAKHKESWLSNPRKMVNVTQDWQEEDVVLRSWEVLGVVGRHVGGREQTPPVAEFPCPPVLVALVSHGDDVAPSEL